MNLGFPTRFLLGVGACLCLWGAPGEIGAQSSGAKNWASETSFMALQIRALGGLKLGIGMAMLGTSLLGISSDQGRNRASELLAAAAQHTAPAPPPTQAIGSTACQPIQQQSTQQSHPQKPARTPASYPPVYKSNKGANRQH